MTTLHEQQQTPPPHRLAATDYADLHEHVERLRRVVGVPCAIEREQTLTWAPGRGYTGMSTWTAYVWVPEQAPLVVRTNESGLAGVVDLAIAQFRVASQPKPPTDVIGIRLSVTVGDVPGTFVARRVDEFMCKPRSVTFTVADIPHHYGSPVGPKTVWFCRAAALRVAAELGIDTSKLQEKRHD